MKFTIKYFIIALVFSLVTCANGQVNNWAKLDSSKHIATLYSGLDYGFVYGLHYGKIVKNNSILWVPFVNVSLPLGGDVVDDYKLKVGTALKVLQRKNWIVSLEISIINRQNKNPFVIMQSLGFESGLQFGYYKQKWFVNLNLSTDNSLTTHLKHTDAYKGNYSEVADGWYQNTANNISFGSNIGYSFKKLDITFSSGLIRTDGLHAKPYLPFYGKIGFNYRF